MCPYTGRLESLLQRMHNFLLVGHLVHAFRPTAIALESMSILVSSNTGDFIRSMLAEHALLVDPRLGSMCHCFAFV